MCRPCTPWGLICPLPSTSARTEVKKGLEREGEGRDRDKETERERVLPTGEELRGLVSFGLAESVEEVTGFLYEKTPFRWFFAEAASTCEGSSHCRRGHCLGSLKSQHEPPAEIRHGIMNSWAGWTVAALKKKWNTCGYSSYLINWTCDITWLNII